MIAAIVPAAGLSARMGRPKLVLEIGGSAVIVRVTRALIDGGADRVFVVVPPADQDGAARIRQLVELEGAEAVVLPAPTPDMRGSIEAGLKAVVAAMARPDGVLIAPGDSIGMTASVVASVVARFRSDPTRIVVPRREGSRGHPVAFPWEIAATIADLPPDVGVDALLRNYAERVVAIAVADPGPDLDLDTPEDYKRLIGPGLIPNSFGFPGQLPSERRIGPLD